MATSKERIPQSTPQIENHLWPKTRLKAGNGSSTLYTAYIGRGKIIYNTIEVKK
jgi:hypothetical protein